MSLSAPSLSLDGVVSATSTHWSSLTRPLIAITLPMAAQPAAVHAVLLGVFLRADDSPNLPKRPLSKSAFKRATRTLVIISRMPKPKQTQPATIWNRFTSNAVNPVQLSNWEILKVEPDHRLAEALMPEVLLPASRPGVATTIAHT